MSFGSERPGRGLRRAKLVDVMRKRKAQVRNGRLVLDEPTDLPEGAEVDVVVFDDELTAEERAELHASLDRALVDSEEGLCVDPWEYLARYKRVPESHLEEARPPRGRRGPRRREGR